MLEPREPVLYFIQRLRDEAHRFAIGTHRARRAQGRVGAIRSTRWPASGRSARRRCSSAFGSAKGVSRASIADLENVEGISRSLARSIYGHFHEGRE